MKNYLLIFCLLSVYGLMSCTDKKATEEKTVAQTPSAPEVKAEDDGVVIMKQAQEDTLKGSLKAYAKGKVGEAEIKITYHSPAVRGRIVWGGLVPFDRVWVTGAHMATTIESNFDFILDKTVITAGKYGLFTIPGKDKWVIIINKNWQQHLADEYDSKDDVARIEVTPSLLSEHQERLRYEIVTITASDCTVNFSWEKLQIRIPITIMNPNFD